MEHAIACPMLFILYSDLGQDRTLPQDPGQFKAQYMKKFADIFNIVS